MISVRSESKLTVPGAFESAACRVSQRSCRREQKCTNGPGHHTVVTVQALRVVLEPNLFKQAFATKGNATPVMLLAAHMIPSASPFFCMNHWSIYRDDGLNMSALPMAHITPWVAMRCHICREKDDRKEPITVIASPVGMHQIWRRGYRVKRVNVTGDKRYRRPLIIALDHICPNGKHVALLIQLMWFPQ